MKIEWDNGPNASLDDATIAEGLQAAAGKESKVARKDGDVDAALKAAKKVVKSEYTLPLLAHATLEPQNCTAWVRDGKC